MESSQEMITRARLGRGSAAGLFFLLYYLYVWLVIDPRLVFHGIGILMPYSLFSFYTGWPFFVEHLSRVGGLMEYAARLLTQFYAFGWAGALIVTAVAWCMGVCTEWLVRRGGRGGGNVLRYLPAAIVLVMYGSYNQPLGPVLSLLTALGAFALYVRLAPEALIRRGGILLIACLVLYHVAGAASLLFPVLVAVDELLVARREPVAVAALTCAVVIPCAAGVLFGVDFREAYAGFLVEGYAGFLVSAPGVAPGSGSYTLALYLFFPTVLAGSVLWGNARAGEVSPGAKAASAGPTPERRSREGGPSPSRKPRRFAVERIPARAVAAAAFFLGIGAAAWFSLDSRTRTVLETDYYAQRERWTEVLRSAERLPEGTYNLRYNRNIMQALYHTGRLPDEMFRYPQRGGVDLVYTPPEYRDLGAYFQESRLFLDLGHVNLAERGAYEALANTGEQPAILKQLALIYVLKGRPEAARVCLRALGKHLFQRRASREMLRRLEADPALENDRRASRIRANMVSRDAIAQEIDAEGFLQVLLESNPHNKMAFELLMAHYLCDGRPEKVVANLPRLRDFSYPRVPRYFQEALAVYSVSSNRPLPVAGLEPDPEVLRRLEDFQRIMSGATSPEEALGGILEAGLGDSYFFYLASGVSGG